MRATTTITASAIIRCAISILNEGQKRAATNFADRFTVPGDLLTDDELQEMDRRVHEIVDDAAEFAENSPEPGEDELYTHVYASEDVNGRLWFDGRRDTGV